MAIYYQTPTNLIPISCSVVCDFGTPGCSVFTVPAGITSLTFEIWGAGGGGGAHCCCDCYHGGPPGAGGGYSSISIATTAGCTYTVCVGAGGMVSCVGSCTLHWCCFGQAGGTTYVTGYNLSNFCATGGGGGVNDCYYICGCNIPGGMGYGGTINACGGYGSNLGYSDAYMWRWSVGGQAAMGASNRPFSGDHCCVCMIAYPGNFPAAGGGTVLPTLCCCCSQGGTGGNGLVRIHY